jgi:hypothetical protein
MRLISCSHQVKFQSGIDPRSKVLIRGGGIEASKNHGQFRIERADP